MKQVFSKKGNIIVEEVPAPLISDNEVLVHVYYSCISAGTEISILKSQKKSLIRKAIEKPQNIQKLLKMLKEKGLSISISRVKSKITGKYPIGYSAAGVVLEIGKNIKTIKPGDRVACAGAGIANHAEFIAVPENLVVKVPDNLSLKAASTVALGAIALQGVRRCDAKIGDFVTVVGMGILGQITSQLLNISGCKTIGIDLDQRRVEKAISLGLYKGINATNVNAVDEVIKITNGYGSDSVIITAASSDELLLNQSIKMCRKKGRVVIVGDVLINIDREEFYERELDILISTSYGPGRYDEKYELKGYKYPYEYIRWTENRNMQEYLHLISEGKLKIDKIIERVYPVDEASIAYDKFKSSEKPLIVLLEYNKEAKPEKKLVLSDVGFGKRIKLKEKKIINVGIIGAGLFAQEVHLPNLKKMENIYKIYAINCKSGSKAESIANNFGAIFATTDYSDILNDKNIDMVIIATRHNLHAPIAIDAAKAGKAIFLEKPLALNDKQLKELVAVLEKAEVPFTVGFNRRYSPFIVKVKQIINDRVSPLIVNYRMNAGLLPKDNWVYTEEGGGRNIGEACHIYDLYTYLTESEAQLVSAMSIESKTEHYKNSDNFLVNIKYKDGSVCNLIYTSLGAKSTPKEQMEIYFDNKLIYLNDYKELFVFDEQKKLIMKSIQDKGYYNQLKEFGNYLFDREKTGIIPLWQLVKATEISFEVEKKFYSL